MYLSVLVLNGIVMRHLHAVDDHDDARGESKLPAALARTTLSEEDRRRVLYTVTAMICPIHAECERAMALAGSHVRLVGSYLAMQVYAY